jgi:hypothetical protein
LGEATPLSSTSLLPPTALLSGFYQMATPNTANGSVKEAPARLLSSDRL